MYNWASVNWNLKGTGWNDSIAIVRHILDIVWCGRISRLSANQWKIQKKILDKEIYSVMRNWMAYDRHPLDCTLSALVFLWSTMACDSITHDTFFRSINHIQYLHWEKIQIKNSWRSYKGTIRLSIRNWIKPLRQPLLEPLYSCSGAFILPCPRKGRK